MPRSPSLLAALLLTLTAGTAVGQAPARDPAASAPEAGQMGVSRFAAGPQAQWPVTLPEAKATLEVRAGSGAKTDAGQAPEAKPNPDSKARPDAKAAPAQAPAWSKAEVDLARSRCNALLAGLDVVQTAVEPIREGECGTPAAVELISVGRNPQISLSPPAIVTCELAAALDKFVKAELQPAAREMLGAPIVRLEVMSAYSCRNAYGRKKTRLSEHGRANALDIGAFITQKSETVAVLAEWGPTERDIKARIAAQAAAAKAAAAKAEAIKREAEKSRSATPGNGQKPPAAAAAAGPVLRGPVIDLPGGTDHGAGSSGRSGPALGLSPSRLGGPKAEGEGQGSPRQRFLKRIHAAACRAFATILGPEANEAHRNHFHVDMAERSSGHFCE